MSELKNHEKCDDELFKDLLSLTKNMSIEPGRNDLCYCMSGKKYKKCCADKERRSESNLLEMKEFYLAPDTAPEVFQYDMSDADYFVAADCYEQLLTGEVETDSESVEILDSLLEKYSTHPALNIAQAVRYLMKGENKAFEKVIQRNLEKFPNDRINHLLLKFYEYDSYATQCLTQTGKKTKEAPLADTELKHAYDKEQMTQTELLLTFSLQIFETLFEEKLLKAMHLMEMMADILEKIGWEDHFLLIRLEQHLLCAKCMRKVKIFLANCSDGEVNHCGPGLINA